MQSNTAHSTPDIRRISLFGTAQQKAWLKSKLYEETQFELMLKQERLKSDKQREDDAAQHVEFHRRQLQSQAAEREDRRRAQLRAVQDENRRRADELEQQRLSERLRH